VLAVLLFHFHCQKPVASILNLSTSS
jgi:hypothetical protein